MGSVSPGPLKDLSIFTEDGIEHNIFGGNIKLMHLDGTGVAQVDRILQKTPLESGAQDKGFRVQPRSMVLTLAIYGKDAAEMYTYLDQVAEIFSPTDSALILKATREDNTEKMIQCYLNGSVDFPMSTRIGGLQVVIVPLLCPDPFWYGSTVETSAGFTAGVSTINLPTTDWTWYDSPILELTGPITDAQIVHSPSSVELDLIGTVPALETWTIDFTPGNKSVEDASFVNQFSIVDVTTISAFNLLKILPKKVLHIYNDALDNDTITVTATGTTGASLVNVIFTKRYVSL
jgi:hypothetical protein